MPEDVRSPAGCTSASSDPGAVAGTLARPLTTECLWLAARTAETLLDMDARHRLIGACPRTVTPAVLEWVAANLDAAPGQCVVDLGAGLGGSSSWIAARTGVGVVAFDAVAATVAGLRRLFPGIPAAVARPGALPLPDASVDHAIALGVPDLDDAEDLAASAARVLRPGGRFVAVFHALDRSVDGEHRHVGQTRTGSYLSLFHEAGFDDILLDSLGDLRPPPPQWRRVRRRVEGVVERRHADDLRYVAARVDRLRFHALQREGVIGLTGLVARRAPDDEATC